MLGGAPGFHITVLHIVPEPPLDYFGNDTERREWIMQHRSDAGTMVDVFRKLLVQSGFDDSSVSTEVIVKRCESISGCLIEEVKRLGACTVILGRRGISKKEEFLFGSTTSSMLHTLKDCAVWVVE
jgi:nucleotide-binding universal stress UspA family protein